MDHKMQKHLKKYYAKKHEQAEREISLMDSLIAELVLDHSIRTFRKTQIQKEIDQALVDRNEQDFTRLVKELESLS